MAKQLQLRRGTTSQHSTFTGANGEVTIDTDKKVVVVHDGATAGGIPLAKQATVDTKVDKVTSTDNAIVRFDGVTGQVQNSGVIIDDSGNVGIGTSSPSAKLQVAGGFNAGALGSFPSLISSGAYGGGIGLFDSIGYTGMYATGSGQVLNFFTNANNSNTVASSTKMTLDASGNLQLTSGTGALGYGTGAGGTVTQLTSKSTAVTLNKPSGQIIMNNAALAAGATAAFILYNSLLTGNDNVKVIVGGTGAAGAYQADCTYCVNGATNITIKNLDAVSRTDTVAINFTVIKGAIA